MKSPDKLYDIPETVEEAVGILVKYTPSFDKDAIAKIPKRDLIDLHHGFGTCIRNNFKMWEADSKLVKACAEKDSSIKGKSMYIHPDDASFVIIKAFWEKLQDE